MHSYAIFDHDRSKVGRWLGVAAILLAGAAAQFFAWLQDLSGIDAFTRAVITTGAVYFCADWVFNNYFWKIGFFKIPDLNGTWIIEGET